MMNLSNLGRQKINGVTPVRLPGVGVQRTSGADHLRVPHANLILRSLIHLPLRPISIGESIDENDIMLRAEKSTAFSKPGYRSKKAGLASRLRTETSPEAPRPRVTNLATQNDLTSRHFPEKN